MILRFVSLRLVFERSCFLYVTISTAGRPNETLPLLLEVSDHVLDCAERFLLGKGLRLGNHMLVLLMQLLRIGELRMHVEGLLILALFACAV